MGCFHRSASTLFCVLALALCPGGSRGAETKFSGEPNIVALVVSTEGEPLPGAVVSLCPDAIEGMRPPHAKPDQCQYVGADAGGRAAFEAIPPGDYRLAAVLDGFATTVVFPLSIASKDPRAPDRVVLVLNPVCYHC